MVALAMLAGGLWTAAALAGLRSGWIDASGEIELARSYSVWLVLWLLSVLAFVLVGHMSLEDERWLAVLSAVSILLPRIGAFGFQLDRRWRG